jgi:hypothetical protein
MSSPPIAPIPRPMLAWRRRSTPGNEGGPSQLSKPIYLCVSNLLEVKDGAHHADGVFANFGVELLEVGRVHGVTGNCVAGMDCRAEYEWDAAAAGGELPPSKPCACSFIPRSGVDPVSWTPHG